MAFNYSLSITKELSRDDPLFWSQPTPVNCNIIRIVGIFLCLAAIAGIVCNGIILYSFARYKTLRSPSNIFVMFIAGMGFFTSCTILPLTGTSSIYCQWLYYRVGCYMDGIIAFLYGCASSYLLCAVSISRCYIIVRPFNANKVTVEKCVIASCGVVLISFIWTMMPIMGWNEYTMEEGRTSCCINWYDRRPSYVTFTIFLFIFVYCIPLIILIVTNTVTMIGLKQMREKIERGIQASFSQKRIEMERRIIKSITITTCGFFITWTPYSVAVLVSMFRGQNYGTPPIVTSICSFFAKSSVVWIPLLYISTSTQFQMRFVHPAALADQTAANQIGPVPTNSRATMCKNNDIRLTTIRKNNKIAVAPAANESIGDNDSIVKD